jgi:hypothetical protein
VLIDAIGGPIRWRLHAVAAPEHVFAALATDGRRPAFWAESAVETHAPLHLLTGTLPNVFSTMLEPSTISRRPTPPCMATRP